NAVLDYLVNQFSEGHDGETILNAMQKIAVTITQDESLAVPSGKSYEEKTGTRYADTNEGTRAAAESESEKGTDWRFVLLAISPVVLLILICILDNKFHFLPKGSGSSSGRSSSGRYRSSGRSSGGSYHSSSSSHRSGGGGRTGGGGASSGW
ncbi:MAG: hypothetical protein IIU46_08480, partial [Treponema sp.]|nr:hypothetical protein [Treponema sp.]